MQTVIELHSNRNSNYEFEREGWEDYLGNVGKWTCFVTGGVFSCRVLKHMAGFTARPDKKKIYLYLKKK
jgi:hypothetical protein